MKKFKKLETRIVGNKQYSDIETGEIIDCTIITKQVNCDYNFHKVWINDLMHILDAVGGKKLKVVKYILSNFNNSSNTFTKTVKNIVDGMNKVANSKNDTVSRCTVLETIKILIDSGFMKKIHVAHYQLNPNIIVRGDSKKRSSLLIQYRSIEVENSENTLNNSIGAEYEKVQ